MNNWRNIPKKEIKFQATIYKIVKYSGADDEYINNNGIKYNNIDKIIIDLKKDKGCY